MRFCAWLATGSTSSRCRTSSTATSTRRSTWPRDPSALVRLVRLGGLRKLAPTVAGTSSTIRACSRSSRSSRCTPASRRSRRSRCTAIITYMDTVEGVFFPDGGMHAIRAGLAPRRREGGRDVSTRDARSSGSPGVPTGRCAVCGSRRASMWPPTRSCATSTWLSRTGRCSGSHRRGSSGGAATRRRAPCGWRACVGRSQPAPRTTTSTSADRVARARSTRCSGTGGACPTRRSW